MIYNNKIKNIQLSNPKKIKKMEENLFTFGTALYSEKKSKSCFINECESFVTITVKATNVRSGTLSGQTISFKCDSFEVVESECHKDWEKIFNCQKKGNEVRIKVPENYIPGLPILGRK